MTHEMKNVEDYLDGGVTKRFQSGFPLGFLYCTRTRRK